jgi:hypothetical protein
MALKITLFSLADEFNELEYQSPLLATQGDTYATFRAFLEDESLVDFAFEFWIAGDKKRMLPRFERFNVVGKEVIVISKVGVVADCSTKRKVANGCDVVLDSEGALADLQENLGVSNTKTLDFTQPASSSRVGGTVDDPPENHLLSQLVSKEIMH